MTAKSGEISLTTLVDNLADDGLATEHGFSLWIETPEKRILFDTGQGPALAENANNLKCDLSSADILVLSHGHYDHTGGVPHVLKFNREIEVFCHAGTFLPRYSIAVKGHSRNISMPQETSVALLGLPSGGLHWVAVPQRILPGIGITGKIPRLNLFENPGGPFFLDPNGQRQDLLDDDQALWIETERGLVIIVGCCHAGLLNTVEFVRRESGGEKVRGIVGGLHLEHASPERLQMTCRAIGEWDLEFIIPCHCTGERAVASLRNAFGDKVRKGRAGLQLLI